MTKALSPHECFLHHVTPGRFDECWEWHGGKTKDGYGSVKNAASGLVTAHRLSYALYWPPIDTSLCVLHTCGNRACVNPHHLYQGTPADNMRDALERGKRTVGSKNYNAVLSEEDVTSIRRLLRCGAPQKYLAARYGVGQTMISAIKLGKKWKYVAGE